MDELFDRARYRLLGRGLEKIIRFTARPAQHREDLSLGGLFDQASRSEGMQPSERLKGSVERVADQYLSAHRELAKARVTHAVQSFLTDAEARGEVPDVRKVLGGELAVLMGTVVRDVRRVVDTEATRAKNTGVLDAVTKINAVAGVDDPVVYFVVVRDQYLCPECKRLHLLSDGVTPRLWLLSEVGAGYHKRGDQAPKVGGLHPHCRCQLVTLMRGWGFDAAGKVTHVGPDHDEFARQRGLEAA